MWGAAERGAATILYGYAPESPGRFGDVLAMSSAKQAVTSHDGGPGRTLYLQQVALLQALVAPRTLPWHADPPVDAWAERSTWNVPLRRRRQVALTPRRHRTSVGLRPSRASPLEPTGSGGRVTCLRAPPDFKGPFHVELPNKTLRKSWQLQSRSPLGRCCSRGSRRGMLTVSPGDKPGTATIFLFVRMSRLHAFLDGFRAIWRSRWRQRAGMGYRVVPRGTAVASTTRIPRHGHAEAPRRPTRTA